jgi:hypothetical protein
LARGSKDLFRAVAGDVNRAGPGRGWVVKTSAFDTGSSPMHKAYEVADLDR